MTKKIDVNEGLTNSPLQKVKSTDNSSQTTKKDTKK